MGLARKSLEAQNFWTKTAENVTICLDGSFFFSNVWLSYLQTKASGHAGKEFLSRIPSAAKVPVSG